MGRRNFKRKGIPLQPLRKVVTRKYEHLYEGLRLSIIMYLLGNTRNLPWIWAIKLEKLDLLKLQIK